MHAICRVSLHLPRLLHLPSGHSSSILRSSVFPARAPRAVAAMSTFASSDTRVVIAYSPSQASSDCGQNSEGQLLHLRNPKSGAQTCYLLMDGILQELHWSKQCYSSWFLGNFVLEDGSLYMCTPVDPIFLVLPILDEARLKKGEDLGKFRALEEILFVDGYPGYGSLQPVLQDSLDAVCEVREVGTSKFYRLDDSKVLAWLCCKVKHTLEGLQALGASSIHNLLEEEKKAYTVELVGEYLKAAPWLDMLCGHLSVDLNAFKKVRTADASDINLTLNSGLVTSNGKTSNGKSKSSKKGPPAGTRKMSEFFALKR